ncbi:MAG: Flp family type IVb pilin [Parvularculaceae bacterium]
MTGLVQYLTAERTRVARAIDRFAEDERGATAIEYGLIVALLFLAIVGAVRNFSSATNDMYSEIESTLTE